MPESTPPWVNGGMMTPQQEVESRTVQLRLPLTVIERLAEQAKANSLTLEVYLEELAEQFAFGNDQPDLLAEAIKRMTSRTPEQIMADRERVLKTARPGRP